MTCGGSETITGLYAKATGNADRKDYVERARFIVAIDASEDDITATALAADTVKANL